MEMGRVGAELTPELWTMKLLMGPIDASYDQKGGCGRDGGRGHSTNMQTRGGEATRPRVLRPARQRAMATRQLAMAARRLAMAARRRALLARGTAGLPRRKVIGGRSDCRRHTEGSRRQKGEGPARFLYMPSEVCCLEICAWG